MSVREKLWKRVDGVIDLPTTPVMAWSRDGHLFIATTYNIYQVVQPKGFHEDLEAMEVDSDSIEIFSNETKGTVSVEEKAKLSNFDSEALEMSVGSDKLFIVSKHEGRLRLSWVCFKTWRFRHGEKFSDFIEGERCWITQVHSNNLKQDFVDLCGSSFPPCDVVLIGVNQTIFCFPFVKENALPCIIAKADNGSKSKLDFQRTFLNLQIEHRAVHMTTFSSLLSLLKTKNAQHLEQKFLVDDIVNVEYCGNTFFLLTKTGDLWKYSSLEGSGLDKFLLMKNVKSFTAVNGKVTSLSFTNDIYCTDLLKNNTLQKHLQLRPIQTSDILKNIFEASKNIQSINKNRKEQKSILNQLKLVSLSVQKGVELLQSSIVVQMEATHPRLSVELENISETAILGKFWSLQVTFATISHGWLAAETFKLPEVLPVGFKVAFLCQVPKIASKNFPVSLTGTLLFNMSNLVETSIVQSMPLFKHQIGILKCLGVDKVIQSTKKTHDETPIMQLSQKNTNRQSFQTFLMHRNKWQLSQTGEGVFTEKTFQIHFSNMDQFKVNEVPLVKKLQDCVKLETMQTLICSYDGGVLKLETMADDNIKASSQDHELLKAVQKELEILMK